MGRHTSEIAIVPTPVAAPELSSTAPAAVDSASMNPAAPAAGRVRSPMTLVSALAASLLVMGIAVVPFAPVQGVDSNGAHLTAATQSLDIEALASASAKDAFGAAAAPEPPPVAVAAAPPMYTGGGSPAEWMTAAGIPESEWGYVDAIVSRESGWDPNAYNASSGASGLVQALPCEKVPGNCFDPVDNLRWAVGYAHGRYGSWAGAYAFWQENHWW